jgi:hypothetical protein
LSNRCEVGLDLQSAVIVIFNLKILTVGQLLLIGLVNFELEL